MSQYHHLDLQHFNHALDQCKAGGTEQHLAERLGLSAKTIARYRRGIFPENLVGLMRCPELLTALGADATAHINNTTK